MMPRQARKLSRTGVYHVMFRGINRQDIFEDNEDYRQMTGCLRSWITGDGSRDHFSSE